MFDFGLPEFIILVILAIFLILVYFIFKIITKAGFPGWLSFIGIMPIINIVALWVFAFIEWPVEKNRITGKKEPYQMKKKLLILLPLLIILPIALSYLYFEYCSFTVFPGNEAIVTHSGEIVGEPRKSGFHSINPFTQEVHQIEMESLRKWIQEIKKEDSYLLRIYWNVDNSLLFYKKSQQVNVDQELDYIFKETKAYIEGNVDQNIITNIAVMKSKDWNFLDANLKSIVEKTQNDAKEFGVNIASIDIYSQ